MDTTFGQAAGGTPAPAELQAVLNRLLDEAEGSGGGESPPGGREPPSAVAGTPAGNPAGNSAGNPAGTPAGNSAGTPAGNPTGNLLGALMGNPAVLSALPTLTENLAPLLGSLSRGTGSGQGATRPHVIDRHTALLCAVKPYLSPRRQEAAETVIRLCRVWDALERSGISLTGLLGGLGGAEASGAGGTAVPGSSAPAEEVT